MTVIIGLSRLCGLVFRGLGQPQVVAEILAGFALGPTLFGAVAPTLQAMVFPAASLPALQGLADVGLVLFMFVIGLEFDPNLVRGQGRSTVRLSLSALFVPFLLGLGGAWLAHAEFAPPGVSRLAFSLFAGTAVSVTAFPVLARIVAERGLMRSRVGGLAMTGAAIADVLAWILLALAVVVAGSGAPVEVVARVFGVAAFIAFMLVPFRRMLLRLSVRYGRVRGLTPGATATVMLGLLCTAMFAELIGVHALFGAFLYGVAVPREGRLVPQLTHLLENVVVILLLPLYFAAVGLKTDLGLAIDGAMGSVTLVVLLVAVGGKVAGVLIPARLSGLPWRETGALAALMNARGLMELVVLGVGLELGVIDQRLFAALVVMALVTTLAATPLVAVLMPRTAAASTPAAPPGADATYNLLVCAARKASIEGMAQVAAALGGTGDARVYALSLEHLEEHVELVPSAEAGATAALTAHRLAERTEALGTQARPISFATKTPSADIVAVARAKKADAVLLGFHQPMIGQAVLGGPLRNVASALDADVLMVHLTHDRDIRVVVVGRGGENDAGLMRVAERLRQSRTVIEVASDAGVDRLLAVAATADLLIVGVGAPYGPASSRLDLGRNRVVTEATCSLMVVSGGDPST
jgi:Kef-type K+ transport system membrane component KefB/ethanolamine utilization microcompartment shell protein EutS